MLQDMAMQLHDFLDNLGNLAESPVSARAVQQGLDATPNAAAVALNLLNVIDLDNPAHGLVQESLAYGLLQGSREYAEWLAARIPDDGNNTPGQVHVSRSGDVIDITLDRPHARNAIDRDMRDALCEAFTVAALDPEVTAVRLRGVGKAFCVGADLEEFGTTRDPATAHCIRMQTLPAHNIIRCMDKFEVHVQGACVGSGLEMAAFASELTASPDAWFQLPELGMGLIPGAGGCVSVSRRIGRKRAALMIVSGKRINAQTALDWGLIDAIMDDFPADYSDADVAR